MKTILNGKQILSKKIVVDWAKKKVLQDETVSSLYNSLINVFLGQKLDIFSCKYVLFFIYQCLLKNKEKQYNILCRP